MRTNLYESSGTTVAPQFFSFSGVEVAKRL